MKFITLKNARFMTKQVACDRATLTEELNLSFTNVAHCTIRGMMKELSYAALDLAKIAAELDALDAEDGNA